MRPRRGLHHAVSASAPLLLLFSASVLLSAVPAARGQQETGTARGGVQLLMEHSVNGRRYDMELHMVHQSAQGKAAVIGVLYEIGARDPFLHMLEPYLEMIAQQRQREEKVGVVDARGARGRASVYYRYVGSLTTPPCAQGVIWTIVKRVRTVSRHQLELLPEAVH
ncbi:alpha carbonic anhydrase 7-like, partial [Triticum dicoccoides]|uniref:alpha carbonic anhydrase 7-like n=1 Tax=Triticum dicoccoides TaxID=85692 RepID=UPI00188DC853